MKSNYLDRKTQKNNICATLKIGGDKKCISEVKVFDFRMDEGIRIRKDGISPTLCASHTNQEISNSIMIVHNLQPRLGNPEKGGTGHLKRQDNMKYCLDTTNSQVIESKEIFRRLTPIECERLQSFPDDWTGGESDTIRYRVLGNSVTVNVIEYIAKRL